MRWHRLAPWVFTITASFVVGAVTPRDQLPRVFADLVPPGYKLVSPGFTRSTSGDGDIRITNVGVNFVASKPFRGRHFHFDGELHFDLVVMEYPEFMLKTRGKYYKIQLDQDIESARGAYASHRPDAITGYDTTKESQYPWGWGITQRRLHHYVGAGAAPDDIDYTGEYHGLILGATTVKKFKLLVSGAKTAEEADQWAHLCADSIEKTAPGEIQ